MKKRLQREVVLVKRWDQWGPTLLRLVLGAIFVRHGWGKVQGFWGWMFHGEAWDFVNHVAFMPVLPSTVWAILATFGEFVGGLVVIAGFWVRAGAAVLAAIMLAAILGVHLPAGDSIEFQVALTAMALSLILTGPGRYSTSLRR